MADLLLAFFNIVTSFFNDIAAFATDVWEFLINGLYDFFTEWYAAFVIWATVSEIKAKLWAIGFSWDVAEQVINQLNISATLSAAWSSVDVRVLNALTFFHVPEAINILLTARITRFVLRFMGL